MTRSSSSSSSSSSLDLDNSCEKCQLRKNQNEGSSSNLSAAAASSQPFLYRYSEWWRVFAYFNSCINPVLYFSISKSFKKQFLQFIGVTQVQKLSKRIKRRWNSSRSTSSERRNLRNTQSQKS